MTERPDFDPKHPHGFTTSDGRPVRLFSERGSDVYPIVGMVEGDLAAHSWTASGRWRTEESAAPCSLDLINAPAPKRRVLGWVVIRPRSLEQLAQPRRVVPWGLCSTAVYATQEIADSVASDTKGALSILIDQELDD